jgi:hypothetical protein
MRFKHYSIRTKEAYDQFIRDSPLGAWLRLRRFFCDALELESRLPC